MGGEECRYVIKKDKGVKQFNQEAVSQSEGMSWC
jgi:hypothetical protein